jgi:hypothetical protein
MHDYLIIIFIMDLEEWKTLKKEINVFDSPYELIFEGNAFSLSLNLKEVLGYKEWKGNFDLSYFGKDYNILKFKTTAELVDTLYEKILQGDFTLQKHKINFNFCLYLETKHIKRMKKSFTFILTLQEKPTLEERVEKLFSLFILFKSKCQKFIKEEYFKINSFLSDTKIREENEKLKILSIECGYDSIKNKIEMWEDNMNLALKKENEILNQKIEDLSKEIKTHFEKVEEKFANFQFFNPTQGGYLNVNLNPQNDASFKELQFINPDPFWIFISNSNKTIEKIAEQFWIGVKINDSIPVKGNYSYRIKIENTIHSSLMVGFSINNEQDRRSSILMKNCFMFYLSDGDFYHRGKNRRNLNPNCRNGDIVEISLDIEGLHITLLVNDQIIGERQKLKISETEIGNISSCVALFDMQDRITLLD